MQLDNVQRRLILREGLGLHNLQRAVRSQRIQADAQRLVLQLYQLGQKVWLSTQDIKLSLPCKKPRYTGPFTSTHLINPVTYQLQLPSHHRIHPAFHVPLLKPFH